MQRLRSNARVLRRALRAEGFPAEDVEMHIVPLIVGEARDATSLCEAALERGVFAQAIRPPTVAPGTSRLRLAAMATHTAEELRDAARVIGDAARELGLDPAATASRAARVSGRAEEGDAPERRVATPAPVVVASPGSPPEHVAPIQAPFDGERDIVVHRAA